MLAGYSLQAEEMPCLEAEKQQLHICQDMIYVLHEGFIFEAMGRSVKLHQGHTRLMQE